MTDEIAPDSTAVRTALWRALHVHADPPPHVLEDVLGLALADEPGRRERPDMAPWSRRLRNAIVARARFIEDLVTAELDRGNAQYVLLGAGLDTFVQRRPELAARLRVFEVDRPGASAWKRQRLTELGLAVPILVPVDFEAGASWWDELVRAGFDTSRPAVVTSTGVSMYLTREATAETLRQIAALAKGSTLAMTFMPPFELLEGEDRQMAETARQGAARSGTPFISLYPPAEILALARDAGFDSVGHVPGAELARRYYADRTDGLEPARGEDFLLATT